MSEDRARIRAVEIGVLIVVVTIAACALIPALTPSACVADGRSRCQNNLRNVAQAISNYELVKRQWPGYVNRLMLTNGQPFIDPKARKPSGVSWVVPLFDYIDNPVLSRMWRTPLPAVANGDHAPSVIPLTILICPSNSALENKKRPLSYVVNCGMREIAGVPAIEEQPAVPRDWESNGVFFDHYSAIPLHPTRKGEATLPVRMAMEVGSNERIPDGTANTIMLSENVDAGEYTDTIEAKVGIVWDATGKLDVDHEPPHLVPPDHNMRINVGTGKSEAENDHRTPDDTTFARPSSWHPGGVNMAFCDGRVKFVSEKMDYYVYCLLMSSDGANVRLPGNEKVLSGFDCPLFEQWYLEK